MESQRILNDWSHETLQRRIDEGERLLRETPREWGWEPLVERRLGDLRGRLSSPTQPPTR